MAEALNNSTLFGRVATPNSSEPSISEGSETLSAVCEEVTNCLIGAALVTSALNIVVAQKQTKPIDHVFRYLPGEAATVAAVTRGKVPIHLDSATNSTLNSLLERIKAGKTAILQCAVFDGQCDDLGSRELADLCLSWRRICVLGIAALCCLERACKPIWSAERLRTLDRLVELLGSARNGECPYLDVDGYPLVPHWAEQRQHRRQVVDLSAKVKVDGLALTARVVDISSDGIGLDRVFGLRTGRRVGVELEDGRKLHGEVAWSAGGRAGLQACDRE
jgi:hypothetical protein